MKDYGPILKAVETVILALPRHKLRSKSNKKLKALNSAILTCLDTKAKLAKHSVPEIVCLFDASLFCLLFDADLTVLCRDMSCRSNWWESRLYARLLAMTMLECVEDVPQVLGKSFRNALNKLAPQSQHLTALCTVSKTLSDFRKNHEGRLRPIRQIMAAHRDHDPNLIVSSVTNLDLGALIKLAGDLNDALSKFSEIMSNVISDLDVFKEIFRSMAKK